MPRVQHLATGAEAQGHWDIQACGISLGGVVLGLLPYSTYCFAFPHGYVWTPRDLEGDVTDLDGTEAALPLRKTGEARTRGTAGLLQESPGVLIQEELCQEGPILPSTGLRSLWRVAEKAASSRRWVSNHPANILHTWPRPQT